MLPCFSQGHLRKTSKKPQSYLTIAKGQSQAALMQKRDRRQLRQMSMSKMQKIMTPTGNLILHQIQEKTAQMCKREEDIISKN